MVPAWPSVYSKSSPNEAEEAAVIVTDNLLFSEWTQVILQSKN